MRFGTSFMGVRLNELPLVARGFEAAGFESLWIPEHLAFPNRPLDTYPYADTSAYPTPDAETPTYDPWAVLAYLCAATTTIRLGTNIFIAPLRHPLQIARSVVTVDRLSGGRVILGIGVGWLQDEFEYLGLSFRDRGRRTDEIIEALRRLWSEETTNFDGEFYRFGPLKFRPQPRQRPTIPIEVGGSSPPALRRAARVGDGWIEVGSRSLDEFREKLSVIVAEREEAGRQGDFEVTVTSPLGNSLDDYKRLEAAGATRVIVVPPVGETRPRVEEWIRWSQHFAESIIDPLKRGD